MFQQAMLALIPSLGSVIIYATKCVEVCALSLPHLDDVPKG